MNKISLSEQSQLEGLCNEFRSALERCKNRTSMFKDFPGGCCRDTSILLNEFLKGKGFERMEYCSKGYGDLPSHAWLEYNNRIIDLTADQFGQQFPSVLILSKQKASDYHVPEVKREPGLYIAGIDAFSLLKDYEIILKEIDCKSPSNN